jgi:hypothetical protein
MKKVTSTLLIAALMFFFAQTGVGCAQAGSDTMGGNTMDKPMNTISGNTMDKNMDKGMDTMEAEKMDESMDKKMETDMK